MVESSGQGTELRKKTARLLFLKDYLPKGAESTWSRDNLDASTVLDYSVAWGEVINCVFLSVVLEVHESMNKVVGPILKNI